MSPKMKSWNSINPYKEQVANPLVDLIWNLIEKDFLDEVDVRMQV